MQNQFVLGFISIIDMIRESNDLYWHEPFSVEHAIT